MNEHRFRSEDRIEKASLDTPRDAVL